MKTFKSDISHHQFPIEQKISAKTLTDSIYELIAKDYPNFTKNSFISVNEFQLYKEKYLSEFLAKNIGELSELEEKVLTSLKHKTILTDKLEDDELQTSSFSQRVADKVAAFGGSWTFIISFSLFICFWIVLNSVMYKSAAIDPFPFILLNLLLSCIAAFQAPVIMMSQNRQEEKDRERAKKDYMVNLKAELEIRILHEKIDHIILHQQHELIDFQNDQIEMMKNILSKLKD
ncbi:MAG: DUF1003 domain-containing protein [Saprospiraceae bacterium]|nr:DUF1003 domain-containing protein [Saprospiraceae bacterium]